MAKYDVIVMGGGIAGLTAAYELSKKNKKVLVLEKENEVGGRMTNFKVSNVYFSKGAEFITTTYKYLFKLATELKLKTIKIPTANYSLDYKGQMISFSYKSIFKIIRVLRINVKSLMRFPGLSKDFFKLNAYQIEKIATNDKYTLNEGLARVFGKELIANLIDPIIRITFHYEDGGDEMSYKYGLAWVKNVFGGKYIGFQHGIQDLPSAIAENIEVKKKFKVESVIISKKEVQIKGKSENGVSVTFKSAKAIIAIPGKYVPLIVKDMSDYEKTFFEKVRYSAVYTVFIKSKNNFLEKSQIKFYETSKNNIIDSITKLELDTKDNHYYFSVKIRQNKIADILEIDDKVLKEKLIKSEQLPGAFEIIYRQYWEAAIPKFYPGYMNSVVEFRKKMKEDKNNRIKYCGDYLFGPYTEGAAQSGIYAASLIDS